MVLARAPPLDHETGWGGNLREKPQKEARF